MSITAHREAVEALLVAAGLNLAAATYQVGVYIDAGPGAAVTRRQSSDYAARDFLVHTNVDALSREQREALLDRVMTLENARPAVAGRVCDPLTVHASISPDPNRDLADREVWTASVIWRLRSYAA